MKADKILSTTKPLPLIDGSQVVVINRRTVQKEILNLRKILDSIQALGWALDHMEPKVKKEAVPMLAGALNSNHAILRKNAAWALGKIGPEAKEAIPALGKALYNEEDAHIRVNIAWALGRLGGLLKLT